MYFYSSIVGRWSVGIWFRHWVFALWLDLVDLLAWIGAHIWWLSWVEECVTLLNGIADIYVAILPSFGDGNSTWPSHGFDNIDRIRFRSLTNSISLIISAHL